MFILKSIKNKIYKYKKIMMQPEHIEKLKLTKKFRTRVATRLKQIGFSKIKNYSIFTWKYRGENHIRITLLAIYKDKKYIIKVSTGYNEKAQNSIKFQSLFNDKFDFIPRGFEVELGIKNVVCYATEYLKTYPFEFMKYTKNETLANSLMRQSINILDELNNHKIVHCDLAEPNLLVSVKNKKLYLIDFDTSCSENGELNCAKFPPETIHYKDGNSEIYDDAYSFYILFSNFQINKKKTNSSYLLNELKNRIGRNIHLVHETHEISKTS